MGCQDPEYESKRVTRAPIQKRKRNMLATPAPFTLAYKRLALSDRCVQTEAMVEVFGNEATLFKGSLVCCYLHG